MGLQSFADYGKIPNGKVVKTRFYTGNQYDFDAGYAKIRYEVGSGCRLDRDKFTFIEVRNGAEVKASAMYVDFNGWSITIHIHAPSQLKKNVIRKFLGYPFHEARVKVLFAPIRASNETMFSIAKRIGFKEHCVIPDYFGLNEDQVMLRAQASDVKRWLE